MHFRLNHFESLDNRGALVLWITKLFPLTSTSCSASNCIRHWFCEPVCEHWGGFFTDKTEKFADHSSRALFPRAELTGEAVLVSAWLFGMSVEHLQDQPWICRLHPPHFKIDWSLNLHLQPNFVPGSYWGCKSAITSQTCCLDPRLMVWTCNWIQMCAPSC